MAKRFTPLSPVSDPTAPVPTHFWRPVGGESVERGIGIGTGGVADARQMNSTAAAAATAAARPLFTVSQWQELELQARIFKHLATGEAVPIHLVDHFRKSLESMASRYYHHPAAAAAAALGYYSYFGKKLDPEPGRCRRTDGKKWRCSKEAYPDSKYCERHMHRGRNRSRKPVETPPQSQSQSPSASTVTSPALTGSSESGGGSFQSIPLHSFAGSSTAAGSFPSGAGSSQLLMDPGSYSMVEKEFRYPYGMKAEVDEHSFFSEASGNARGLGIDSSLDSSWRLMSSQTSLFPPSKARNNSSLSSSYLQFTTPQELGQASISSLSKPEQQQQHSFFGSEFGLVEPVKHESQSLRPFFDEWPGTRDMWSDLEDERSNQNSISTTQLSISIPMASSDLSTTNSRSPNDDRRACGGHVEP